MLQLVTNITKEDTVYLHQKARLLTDKVFGKNIYIRGLVEFTNYCSQHCMYCGIRHDNAKVHRYRLYEDDILSICEKAHNIGFRTFVLQGGEDDYYYDKKLISLVNNLHQRYQDTAITLSVGEKDDKTYAELYESGASRFLLRHETIDKERYHRFHPKMSYDNRIRCIHTLKRLNYQTGIGFLVGLPNQEICDYVEDLMFIKDFNPKMVGIGPFIPHKDTPLKDASGGDVETTLIMLSIIRLLLPNVLLPTSTALNTLSENGAYNGFNAGANVLMLNITPKNARKDYNLYEGKPEVDVISEQGLDILRTEMKNQGYILDMSRGDYEGK